MYLRYVHNCHKTRDILDTLKDPVGLGKLWRENKHQNRLLLSYQMQVLQYSNVAEMCTKYKAI